MDVNEYTLECMVRRKLQEAREASRRRALLDTLRRPGWRERPLTALGLVLALLAVRIPRSDGGLLRHRASHG